VLIGVTAITLFWLVLGLWLGKRRQAQPQENISPGQVG
jgi:hypothetical protein